MSSIIDCGIIKLLPGLTYPEHRVFTILKNGHYFSGSGVALAAGFYDIDPPPLKHPLENLVGFDGAGGPGFWSYWFIDNTNKNRIICNEAGIDKTYIMPENIVYADIVGIGLSSTKIYFWGKDGNVFYKGRTSDSFSNWSTKKYSLAANYEPSDVVGMAISAKNICHVWYKNGYRSYGISSDLDYYRKAEEIQCSNLFTNILI